jgi:hypothetical protein
LCLCKSYSSQIACFREIAHAYEPLHKGKPHKNTKTLYSTW